MINFLGDVFNPKKRSVNGGSNHGVVERVLKPGHMISLCFALYHRYNLIQMISQSLEVHFYKPTLQENCVLREIT